MSEDTRRRTSVRKDIQFVGNNLKPNRTDMDTPLNDATVHWQFEMFTKFGHKTVAGLKKLTGVAPFFAKSL